MKEQDGMKGLDGWFGYYAEDSTATWLYQSSNKAWLVVE